MRNIIITGGELFNKGAQAMTFVTVYELKKRFPDHQIYLLSEMDRQRSEEEKAQYAFRFTGWYPVKFARSQHNPVLRLACILRNGRELKECEELYKNCDLMVDISGYGLGSNWDTNQLNTYLDHLEFAKAFDISCYLMPQSFGPFDFEGEKKAIGDRLPELLKTVKTIYAREKEGYDALVEKYGLCNVQMGPDIVLNNKQIDLKNIYLEVPQMELPDIKENSVAIIPNERTVEIMGVDGILSLYRNAISVLLESEKRVYLLTHATPDRKLCEKIAGLFPDEEKIVFLDRDFSCIEYNEIVKRVDFVIASRYHSIVHAFKNRTPCVVLGWAEKYKVLMDQFGQEEYCFDVREQFSDESFLKAIRSAEANISINSHIIEERLFKIQKDNIFDQVGFSLAK